MAVIGSSKKITLATKLNGENGFISLTPKIWYKGFVVFLL